MKAVKTLELATANPDPVVKAEAGAAAARPIRKSAKLAEVCPIEFYDLSNRVTQLTGQGGSRVKPPPSSQPA